MNRRKLIKETIMLINLVYFDIKDCQTICE